MSFFHGVHVNNGESSAKAAKLSREMTARWLADPDLEVQYEVVPGTQQRRDRYAGACEGKDRRPLHF
jgi:hypothetical protein